MRHLRIGTRLGLAFSIIILITFLGNLSGLWQFNQMQAEVDRLNQINDEAIAILQVNATVLNLRNELQKLTSVRDVDRFAEQARRLRDTLRTDVDQAFEILETSPLRYEEPRYTAQLKQLADIGNLSAQIDLMIDLAEADDWLAVQLRLENQVRQIGQITQELVEEINTVVADERDRSVKNTGEAQQQAFLTILATGLLTLAAAAFSGFYVTRSIAQPLARLNRGAKALANRKFDHRVAVAGDDELAVLGQAFDDAASQLAKLYAGLEALVKERTDELHRRAMQLETSLGVGQRITSILDLDTLLAQVTALIKERYGYYYVGVFLLNDGGDYIVAWAGTGAAGRALRDQGFRLKVGEEGIAGWVAQRRRPSRANDVSKDERYVHLELAPDTQSELALPLLIGKKLLGVLDIQSDQRNAFSLDDVPVLQSLADQVSIAIQNAILYQAEQSRRRSTEALYDAGRAISGTLDLKEVLDLILQNLSKIVPHERAALMLKEEDELKIVAWRGFPEDIPAGHIKIFIKENDVFQHISHTQEPLTIANAPERLDWLHIEGVAPGRAWLGVPLIRFATVMGMLSLTRETAAPYTDDEVTLAAAFAGQVAIALENARLYDEITRFSQHLEEAVEERTEELQIAYAQLEHLDQTKTDFIKICAHELRTPLTILQGASQILLNDKDIKASDHHLDLTASIHSGAVRLHEVVNSMLDVTKIDTRALDLYHEPVSMRSLIQSVTRKLSRPLQERKIELTIADSMAGLPAVEADPEALGKVFYHLIVNAIKYTPDGGRITISGRQVKSNGQEETITEAVEVTISDTGIGIDPQFQELIFTKFYQTGQLALHSTGRTKFKGAGPGLGLAIAKGIAEAHHGNIWVESQGHDEETCPGSHFHVLLPLRQNEDEIQTNSGGQEAIKRADPLEKEHV